MKKFLIMVPLFLAACTVNVSAPGTQVGLIGAAPSIVPSLAVVQQEFTTLVPSPSPLFPAVQEKVAPLVSPMTIPTAAPIPSPLLSPSPSLKGNEVTISDLATHSIGIRPWARTMIYFSLKNTSDKDIYYHFTVSFFRGVVFMENTKIGDIDQVLHPFELKQFSDASGGFTDNASVTIKDLRLDPFPVPSQPVSP